MQAPAQGAKQEEVQGGFCSQAASDRVPCTAGEGARAQAVGGKLLSLRSAPCKICILPMFSDACKMSISEVSMYLINK